MAFQVVYGSGSTNIPHDDSAIEGSCSKMQEREYALENMRLTGAIRS